MNNRSIEIIKSIYKPYRYTILKNAHILESTSGNIVIKAKKRNMKELYNYLSSKGITNYPQLIDDSREGIDLYKYIEDIPMPNEEKALELTRLIASLHSRTTYYKQVTEDDYKKIYEIIKEHINYLKYFLNYHYEECFKEIYPSPSSSCFLNNFYKASAALNFSEDKLESWYNKVKDKTSERLCQIHHHVSLEHFFHSDKDYLLSWEESTKDSPVIDMIEFYKRECFSCDFSILLKEYFSICPWSPEEKDLFFICISIPDEFAWKGSEFTIVLKVEKFFDYIFKTETLTRPYYTIDEKEKN